MRNALMPAPHELAHILYAELTAFTTADAPWPLSSAAFRRLLPPIIARRVDVYLPMTTRP